MEERVPWISKFRVVEQSDNATLQAPNKDGLLKHTFPRTKAQRLHSWNTMSYSGGNRARLKVLSNTHGERPDELRVNIDVRLNLSTQRYDRVIVLIGMHLAGLKHVMTRLPGRDGLLHQTCAP